MTMEWQLSFFGIRKQTDYYRPNPLMPESLSAAQSQAFFGPIEEGF